MKNKALTYSLICVCAACFVICAVLLFNALTPKTTGSKQVVLEIQYQNSKVSYDISTEAGTVMEMLLEVDEALSLELEYIGTADNAFITGFFGISADTENYTTYYMYYIDGEMAMLGVSEQPLEDGKTYTFKLLNSDDTLAEGSVPSAWQKWLTIPLIFSVLAMIVVCISQVKQSKNKAQ